ncbi:beta-N-acetylhexosaminidase [Aestuariibacter halophilus]|uniref:N-acetyl-beta-glucosaminidase n=1 Tax=Fluctibacter halophilus TaxID=226011 RepID=A0ABS8GAV3_9ALTE|nr:family 20 glycosylhydrolase [Aestuariibacter halophilus]MCC2617306.1 beta-N-acetylhexosaminidase [Aestuariibacter halophilus]
MKNNLCTLRCLLFLLLCLSIATVRAESLSLMPAPQSVQLKQGHWILPDEVTVWHSGLSADHQRSVRDILASLQRTVILTHASGAKADIYLHVDAPAKPGEVPHLNSIESYRLAVEKQGIVISAAQSWGALHALQTLRQWVSLHGSQLQRGSIDDAPRFAWRGLLLDSVRHFLPVETLKRQLRGMASAKLNVFHWHLTDDQGWRLPIDGYPRLHQFASDGQYYTHQQITDVVSYAASLGIRVMPEVDLPGHASALAVAYPALMSAPGPYNMERNWGVFEPLLDPTNPDALTVVNAVLKQLAALFPDRYVHIGGDEVNPAQWDNNPRIQAYMRSHGLADSHALHAHFNRYLQQALAKHQRHMMGWDEILHPDLRKDVVVQSWRGVDSLHDIVKAGHPAILSSGFYIDQPQFSDYHYRNDPVPDGTSPAEITSSPSTDWQRLRGQMPRLKGTPVVITIWYSEQAQQAIVQLDQRHPKPARHVEFTNGKTVIQLDSWMGPLTAVIATPRQSQIWVGNTPYPLTILQPFDALAKEDVPMIHTSARGTEGSKILGAEATLWSELVTSDIIDQRIWPRLYGIAERLWSPASLQDPVAMYQRLWRMNSFAADVVGLQHHQQWQKGVARWAGHPSAVEDALLMTELLEPAHYYTRHHLHYRQGRYHQQAVLDGLVDILAVESAPMLQLERQIRQFTLAPSSAEQLHIQQTLQNYQSALKRLQQRFSAEPKLALVDRLQRYVEQGLALLHQCGSDNVHYTLHQTPSLPDNEIVMAIARPVAQLVKWCDNRR